MEFYTSDIKKVTTLAKQYIATRDELKAALKEKRMDSIMQLTDKMQSLEDEIMLKLNVKLSIVEVNTGYVLETIDRKRRVHYEPVEGHEVIKFRADLRKDGTIFANRESAERELSPSHFAIFSSFIRMFTNK